MDSFYHKHYVSVDESGRITDGWSDGPHPEKSTKNSACINEQGEYQFKLFKNGQENPILYTKDFIPMYKFVDGQVVHRTEKEIEEDRLNIPPEPPSNAERLEAQVSYTAMMTDTLLEV